MTLSHHSGMHAHIPDYPRCFRTTWCSWANCWWQVTSFPVKGIPIEYGGYVTRSSISSSATAGLWSRQWNKR